VGWPEVEGYVPYGLEWWVGELPPRTHEMVGNMQRAVHAPFSRRVATTESRFAQYPGEKEVTFPPFTCLESDGDPRLALIEGGGEIVVFSLKVLPTQLLRRFCHFVSRSTCNDRTNCIYDAYDAPIKKTNYE
jgi:hypothetical protein